jgi:hypothetical protein
MEANGKSWSLSVFSSARVLKSYTMDQLMGLGVGFVWMGLEGEESSYDKLKGVDTLELVNLLQGNGIRVLGSSILGLEDHRQEEMDAIIEYAVRHDTVFHQFMLYTPIPGTPLHERHKREGNLLPETEFPFADAHGQYRFNYRHPHIQSGEEEKYLLDAFQRDFASNGPSLLRLIRVMLNGWQSHKHHSGRIRDRLTRESAPLRSTYAGAVWAMNKYYRLNPGLKGKAEKLLADIYAAFGWKTRLLAPVIGRYAFNRLMKEEARLAAGVAYEPRSFCEKNAAEQALETSASAELLDGSAGAFQRAEPAYQ